METLGHPTFVIALRFKNIFAFALGKMDFWSGLPGLQHLDRFCSGYEAAWERSREPATYQHWLASGYCTPGTSANAASARAKRSFNSTTSEFGSTSNRFANAVSSCWLGGFSISFTFVIA